MKTYRSCPSCGKRNTTSRHIDMLVFRCGKCDEYCCQNCLNSDNPLMLSCPHCYRTLENPDHVVGKMAMR